MMYLKIFHKNCLLLGVVKHRAFFYGITEGFASASPDYETTSQQDNEWGFARLCQTTTSTCSL